MPARHLFIDSRYRTNGSDSEFALYLPESINLPLGARCFVAAVSFSNVLYTIEQDVTDRLYVAIQHNGPTGGYIFTLNPGNYVGVEFAQEIQT